MKKILLNIYRFIVGNEFGWSGEGNEQWYYFLSLVINCMLTWWLKPELGIVFTVSAVIHYITVYIYGGGMLSDSSVLYSIVYYLIHIIIFIICFVFNWKWTILTSLVVIVAYFSAPNCTGNNIFLRMPKDYENNIYYGVESISAILFFHTILFGIFVGVTLNLPTALWIRIIIIIVCIVLHPIIDSLEDEGIIISEVTDESYEKIKKAIKNRKNN